MKKKEKKKKKLVAGAMSWFERSDEAASNGPLSVEIVSKEK